MVTLGAFEQAILCEWYVHALTVGDWCPVRTRSMFSLLFSHARLLSRQSNNGSGCGTLAKVHRNTAIVLVEHGNQLEACTKRLQVLPKRRDAHIL